MTFSPSTSPFYGSAFMAAFGSGDANGDGAYINITNGNNGYLKVASNNCSVMGGTSATFSANNATNFHDASLVHIDNSSNHVKMTIQTNFPNGLPYIYTAPFPNDTPPVGVAWAAGGDVQHFLGGNSSAGAHGTSVINTSYSAHF